MKPVAISHERCGDYEDWSYMLAPDDWDDDKIQDEIDEAMTDYIAALRTAIKEENPPNGGKGRYGAVPYNDYPDLTVREVQELWAKYKKEYDEWFETTKPTQATFEMFLGKRGFAYPWDDDDAVYYAHWGHMHGTPLKYGNDYKVNNFPSPADLVERVREELENEERNSDI